ncbi:SpaA isopeptide-forming pilin-related protein [Peptoniphilus sp. Marseille-Q6390]
MDNIFKRFTCLLLAFLMVMEVFSPVAALAASLIDEPESQNSTRIEENISGELFNKPAAKAEKTDTRNKEEVHKKTSNKAKETGKAPDLIPAKKTKNDHESMNPAKQTKNDYEILVPAKEKAKPEAKAAEEAKAKEEQAAKEKAELDKIEKEKQEALRIEAERQAQAARANDAEAAAAEAEYRDAHQKRLELEQLLEEKLKEKGLRDQKKQSEKSLNAEESNKLKNTNEEENTEEQEKGLLEKIKEGLGLTDLQRADKELKKALKNKKNGLEEIQALLNTFEDKYDLSREDQAKLMADNEEAFQELIDRDREENFRPQVFATRPLTADEKTNLAGKKFNIKTIFQTSNAGGPIQDYQYFKIHLDDELTVNDPNTLKPIIYNGRVIAKPTYNKDDNIITYNIEGTIPENINIPLDIPVDYNTNNIKLNEDETFVVINKVSGLGVKAPKNLLPQRVNKKGEIVGTIIEPGRHDVTQIIEADDQNYKVDMDAVANPVLKDGELQGYNWTIKVSSDTNLDELGFKANFTTVKGSGLGDISSNVQLTDNPIKGGFGIHDSKHHAPGAVREITYNLYTPVKGMQEKYMMDISVILTAKGKVGAKRIVMDGWPIDKVKETTPIRAGMNNRTTILGEFTSENSAKWTVTDGVSTGDGTTSLPLENRQLEGNQTGSIGQTVVYKIDPQSGQMVVDVEGTNGEKTVGTIAAYEYNSTIDGKSKEAQKLSGVEISKYQDVNVEQNWNLDKGLKMPEMTLKAVNGSGDEIGITKVGESEEANPAPATRDITIPNVKVWNIQGERKFSKNDVKIKQEFPTGNTYNGEPINYYENNNWYDLNKKGYYIHNRATVQKIPKFGNFTLIKKGEDNKPLEGATFKLLGSGEAEVTTNKYGEIQFSNISPGTYTLLETKAPKDYKLNQERTTVDVDDEGRISINGSNAKLSVGTNPTVTVADPTYPDYMNAMQYATKDDQGNVTTYIFLKANSARQGGSTNRNTRISLRVNGGVIENLDDVKVYDVNPDTQRGIVKNAMTQQTVDQKLIDQLGDSVVNKPNNNNWVIRGTPNHTDPYTNKLGYEITFPKERFGRDWGFLVVAKSKPLNGGTNTLTYDWLTSQDTGSNAKLQNQTVQPTSTSEASKGTTITVTNEKFETRPVEITKIDKKENPIVGATFEIRDANDKVISTVTSQAADEKGKKCRTCILWKPTRR